MEIAEQTARARLLLRIAGAIASGNAGALAEGQAMLRGDHAPRALLQTEPTSAPDIATAPVVSGRRRRTGGLL